MVDKTGLWLPRLGVLQIENLAVPGIFKLKGDLILWHKTSKRQKIYERQARLAISKRLILGLLAENSQSENRHGPASGAAAPTVRLYAVVTPFKLLPHVRATNQKNLVNLTFNVRIARFYFPGLIIIDEYSIVVRKNQYPV